MPTANSRYGARGREAEVDEGLCDDLVPLVGRVREVIGKEVRGRGSTVHPVEGVVDIPAHEPAPRTRGADHLVPRVEYQFRGLGRFWRHARAADPVVVPVRRAEDGRLAGPQLRDALIQLVVLGSKRLDHLLHARGVIAGPVRLCCRAIARIVVAVHRRIVVRDRDEDDVGCGEAVAAAGAGVQLVEQHVDLQAVVLGQVLDLDRAPGRVVQRRRVAADESDAARAVTGAVVANGVADGHERQRLGSGRLRSGAPSGRRRRRGGGGRAWGSCRGR